MARIATRFKNQLVYFWSAESEHPTLAFCKGIVQEAGENAYLMVHEDSGLEEPVFIGSVIRIISAKKMEKAAEIHDIFEEKKSAKISQLN